MRCIYHVCFEYYKRQFNNDSIYLKCDSIVNTDYKVTDAKSYDSFKEQISTEHKINKNDIVIISLTCLDIFEPQIGLR